MRPASRLAVFLAMTLGACSEASPRTRVSANPFVASPDCPLRSPSDWQDFLSEAAAEPAWLTTCSDLDNCDELVGDFAVHAKAEILGVLERCKRDLDDNPAIARCTDRLRRFAPAWLRQHQSHAYGFDQPNTEYFARETAADKPAGMMDPPSELLMALPARAEIEALARDRGWPYLTHDSGLGGARIFLLVADARGRFDQWMVLGLDEAQQATTSPAIMSFIGLQRTDAQGALLDRPRPYFRDYLATQDNDGWRFELPSAFGGKCYACHVSGLRQLIPQQAAIAESEPVRGEVGFATDGVPSGYGLERLGAFNERIAADGLTDWADTLEPRDHGPPLGRELGCTDCHDGTTRGALSVFTSDGMLWQKVVQQLSMRAHDAKHEVPDTAAMQLLALESSGTDQLSEAEAAELSLAKAEHQVDFEALMASRGPSLASWLSEQACE